MKKQYIAPDIEYSVNGSLEGVFASSNGDSTNRSLVTNLMGSGNPPILTYTSYCNNSGNWMVNVDNNNGYGDEE